MKSILRATAGTILVGSALLMGLTAVAAHENASSQDTATATHSTKLKKRHYRRAHNAGDSTAPDNTKVNKRDRAAGEPSAGSQKENRSDRTTTQQIRKAVMADKSLSIYAHNVKILTQDGMVTLKGPVHSEEEKQAIETKAKQVAGEDKVTDQLEVKQ